MTRTQYKNKHIKENYDRINLCIPKGEKCKIKAIASEFDISVNEYIFLLLTSDCKNGYSKLLKNRNTTDYTNLLDKWQVPLKYREMIDDIFVEEINGMNKNYTIILKNGYINDITGTNRIYTDKTKEIRRIIVKSHIK